MTAKKQASTMQTRGWEDLSSREQDQVINALYEKNYDQVLIDFNLSRDRMNKHSSRRPGLLSDAIAYSRRVKK